MRSSLRKLSVGMTIMRMDLQSAWARAIDCVRSKQNGYPVSLKEVWDDTTWRACSYLRDVTADMVRSYPDIPEQDIRVLLTTPTAARFGLQGRSPFDAMIQNPSTRTQDFYRAVIAVRNPVYEKSGYGSVLPMALHGGNYPFPQSK